MNIVKADGWKLDRIKGSHHNFIHETKRGTVTIPHPKKDLSKGLIRAIFKQAKIEPKRKK